MCLKLQTSIECLALSHHVQDVGRLSDTETEAETETGFTCGSSRRRSFAATITA